MFRRLLLVTTLSAGCWSTANAEIAAVVTDIDNADIMVVLEQLEVAASAVETDNGYEFVVDDFTVKVAHNGTSLQLEATFASAVDLERLNAWNRDYRYTKAYVNADNNTVFESDFSLEGGATAESIVIFFDTFRESLGLFVGEMRKGAESSNAIRRLSKEK